LYSKRNSTDVWGYQYDVWTLRSDSTGLLGIISGLVSETVAFRGLFLVPLFICLTFSLICLFHPTSYVGLGETPAVAGLRQAEEQMQLSLLTNLSQYVESMKLIGAYNDPVQDLSQGFGVRVTVSYALEFLSSEIATKDGTGIPKAGVDGSTLVKIPMEEIGTTYKQEAWEGDHFAYAVLMDLKKQLNVLS
jgi:hypothetical protein